jgi:hypothetical protein
VDWVDILRHLQGRGLLPDARLHHELVRLLNVQGVFVDCLGAHGARELRLAPTVYYVELLAVLRCFRLRLQHALAPRCRLKKITRLNQLRFQSIVRQVCCEVSYWVLLFEQSQIHFVYCVLYCISIE